MKKALIIGITGFVGPYLRRELLANGYEVYGCGRTCASDDANYILDITDAAAVKKVIADLQPDVIFNLAAVSSVSLSWKQPQQTVNVNVIGTINILEAVAKVCPGSKIILVGSSEEYAPSKEQVSEKSEINPVNPYGITRVMIEEFARVFALEHGLNITCVRAFNHTGIGQTDTFVLASFVKQAAAIAKSGRPGVIKVGNLNVYRDFSDVRDIVRAYRLIAEYDGTIDVINVGSGRAYELKFLLEHIISMSDQKIAVETDKERFRPADLPYCCCDNSLLRHLTKWEPEHSVFDTLREMFDREMEA